MIRILSVCPNPPDAASYYRGYGPLNQLMKKYPVYVERGENRSIEWSVLTGFDILFMQRPFMEEHAKLITLAKNYRLKIWVDHDDNVLEVPKDNPAHPLYNTTDVQKNVKICVGAADLVTVSTPAIKELLSAYNNDIHIVPNALHTTLLGRPIRSQPRSKVVMWRGSNTHLGDFRTIVNTLNNLDLRDYVVHIVGDKDVFNMVKIKKQHAPSRDLIKYHGYIQNLKPEITIVPLVKNRFNDCKSNIAWLESTWAGGVTLATDMREWVRPGITNYSSEEDFAKKLTWLIDYPESHRELWNESKNHVNSKLYLNKWVKKRYSLIKSLF